MFLFVRRFLGLDNVFQLNTSSQKYRLGSTVLTAKTISNSSADREYSSVRIYLF